MPGPSCPDCIAYVNGQFVRNRDARISVFDRGLLYGDGVYEAMRLFEGRLFRLDDHLQRLRNNLAFLVIEHDSVTEPRLRELVLETVRRNGLSSAYLRVIVTRGEARSGIDPRNAETPSVVIFLEDRRPLFLEVDALEGGVVSVRQPSISALDPRKKTLNYVNKILAKIEAIRSGFHVPILLDEQGRVTEAGTENVFAIVDGKVVTPPVELGLLPGITRDSVLKICSHYGYSAAEESIGEEDLRAAESVFVTATGIGIIGLSSVNRRALDPRSARLVDIQNAYLAGLRGQLDFLPTIEVLPTATSTSRDRSRVAPERG